MGLAKGWAGSSAGLSAAVAIAFFATTACSSASPSDTPVVVNHATAGEIFDALGLTDLKCTGKVTLFNGGGTAVCEPIASFPNGALSVAIYQTAIEAEAAFNANCHNNLWDLYRTGENWRGAISTGGPAFPRDKALAVARALNTDVHKGCGPP